MNKQLVLTAPEHPFNSDIYLPASKSVTNRILIIRALTGEDFHIENLSAAEDSRILKERLDHPVFEEYCGAGGTTVRFLLALRCLQSKEGLIYGSQRLMERPVRELVEKLRELGASIDYAEKEGYLPLLLGKSKLHGGDIELRADISSQFVSALLLIAPLLKEPLSLRLKGEMVSAPYLDMTLELMKFYGAKISRDGKQLTVHPVPYSARAFKVPADWSAAAFFYAMAALKPGSEFRLKNLAGDRYQGDRVLRQLMTDFGVESENPELDVIIRSTGMSRSPLVYDFNNTPDLAQAFAVMAAVSNRNLLLSGLSTLKEKEANRLEALKTELEKAGAVILITDNTLQVVEGIKQDRISGTVFHTYADHRMVMALSLLSLSGQPVCIDDPDQVSKSFPDFFWELKKAGFTMTDV